MTQQIFSATSPSSSEPSNTFSFYHLCSSYRQTMKLNAFVVFFASLFWSFSGQSFASVLVHSTTPETSSRNESNVEIDRCSNFKVNGFITLHPIKALVDQLTCFQVSTLTHQISHTLILENPTELFNQSGLNGTHKFLERVIASENVKDENGRNW